MTLPFGNLDDEQDKAQSQWSGSAECYKANQNCGCFTEKEITLCQSENLKVRAVRGPWGKQSPHMPQNNSCKLIYVMVNFMHHLDWATGAQIFGIWSNIILGESVRVLLDSFSIWIDRQSRQPSLGPIRSTEGLNITKRLTLSQIRGNSSCLTSYELGLSFYLTLDLKHWLFLGLEPARSWPTTTPSALLGLQSADWRSQGL